MSQASVELLELMENEAAYTAVPADRLTTLSLKEKHISFIRNDKVLYVYLSHDRLLWNGKYS